MTLKPKHGNENFFLNYREFIFGAPPSMPVTILVYLIERAKDNKIKNNNKRNSYYLYLSISSQTQLV